MPRSKSPPSIKPDYTFDEFCRVLNIGATKGNELIRTKAVESCKLGNDRRAGRRIKRESVERLRNSDPQCVGGWTALRASR